MPTTAKTRSNLWFFVLLALTVYALTSAGSRWRRTGTAAVRTPPGTGGVPARLGVCAARLPGQQWGTTRERRRARDH